MSTDEPHIASPVIRRAARATHRAVATLGRLADRGRAREVGRHSRGLHEGVLRDTLTTHQVVDRVDSTLTRRFGSTSRALVRAWVDSAAAGIDAAALAGLAVPGVATGEEARALQQAPLADITGHQWAGGNQDPGACEALASARTLLDALTKACWQAMRGQQAALEVVLVAAEVEAPWAVGLEALGEGAVWTPEALAERYGSSAK